MDNKIHDFIRARFWYNRSHVTRYDLHKYNLSWTIYKLPRAHRTGAFDDSYVYTRTVWWAESRNGLHVIYPKSNAVMAVVYVMIIGYYIFRN